MISKKNKSFLLTIAILISSSFLSVSAQQSELYKYSNGEGIQIANDNGYLIKIKTYVQPAFETRWNTDSISDDNYDRFRIRRLRLRFDGSDENSKLNYRLQFNFGGVSEVGNSSCFLIELKFLSRVASSNKFLSLLFPDGSPTIPVAPPTNMIGL